MSTFINDVERNAQVAMLVEPVAKTSSVTTTGVDCKDIDGLLTAIQAVGAATGTTPTLNGVIQESPDNSSAWTTVATFDEVDGDGDNTVQVKSFQRSKRYLRYVGTIAHGGSASFTMSLVLFGQKKQVNPVNS